MISENEIFFKNLGEEYMAAGHQRSVFLNLSNSYASFFARSLWHSGQASALRAGVWGISPWVVHLHQHW